MAKTFKLSPRMILSILTIILVVFVVYQNRADIHETLIHFSEMNWLVLLLLIPEQFYMYYALGKIFFSYLEKRKDTESPSRTDLMRISTELNFVNHAVPAGGFGGLAFLTYRLRPYGVTAGQSSFMYIFRYAITTVFNYLQALIAILILFALNQVPSEAMWILVIAVIMNVGIFLGLCFLIFIADSEKRLNSFSKFITNLINKIVKILTFGHKKQTIKYEKIQHFFSDIHESIQVAKRDKKALIKPILWGVVYSLFEIFTYWIVAIALGHPELLPHIMVGEAIGSVFDGIVPYGLYELGMAGVMIALGVDFSTATIITVATRVFILTITIATGWWPYNQTITGKKHERRAE